MVIVTLANSDSAKEKCKRMILGDKSRSVKLKMTGHVQIWSCSVELENTEEMNGHVHILQ